MSFHADCDIALEHAVEDLKEDMRNVLELIAECDHCSESEYYTAVLERDINLFLVEH